MTHMNNTVSRDELAALHAVVEDWGRKRRRHCSMFSQPMPEGDRERLHVARRAMAKVHKLFKQGRLVEPPSEQKAAGGPP